MDAISLRPGAGLVDVSLAIVVKQSPYLDTVRAESFDCLACSVYDLGCREPAPLIVRLNKESLIQTVCPVEMPEVVVFCGLAFGDNVEDSVALALALRPWGGSQELSAAPVSGQASNSLTSGGSKLAASVPEDT